MAVTCEKKDNIAYITIDRPEVMNALDPESFEELGRISTDISNDDSTFAAIITGAGDRAFCTGADLTKTPLPPGKDPRQSVAAQFWEKGWQPFQLRSLMRGVDIWKPIIAAINGFCLAGGLELALACDIRVASENATFGVPEVQRGSMVGLGTSMRLPHAVPLAVAMKMLLTGERIDAGQALQWGLVTDVVPRSELMPTAERIARRIAENAPLSVKAIKLASVKGLDLPLEHGLYLERLLFGMSQNTEDRAEARSALAEGRKPIYRGA